MKGTIWCLHGAVGQAADWRGFGIPGWSVKRVDLWRFLDCCPMSLPEFGRALNREAVAVPGRKVLLGYSMGGRLALHALLEGGPWDAAVLVAPHPGLEAESERATRRAADAEWASKALSGDWSEFLAAWNAQPVLADSGMLPPLSAQRRQAVARSFIDWSLGAQEPLGQRLGEIGCPVLWCAGERDVKFRELGERAVERLSAGELWIAPESGHRVPWDAPEAFQSKAGEFLERVLS
ncbi:alpha/beta fold hydrolase [Luteolibacter marinus]|uniref:alpha/beta fold hydrolase n=1 Tax=Luteolibacter marinus TaxID=2776705 RepID=UPI00186918C7|nr:alpha/beta fold hydrolase [Luteolibacter marinus]